MEGVLVSAKQAGSSVTGTYSLSIRAVGYVLSGPATATVLPQGTTIDLNLGRASNLAAQLNNAEWIVSVPHSRLPRTTNIRRVFVDNSATPVAFWVGSNHGASIIKLEPLD
jgi:hypothetical protein